MNASIPILKVKKLRGSFERDHRGPVERPRAINEIELVAALTRDRNLASIRPSRPAGEVGR